MTTEALRSRSRLRSGARRHARGVALLGAGLALGHLAGLAAAGLLGSALAAATRGEPGRVPLLVAAALLVAQAVLTVVLAATGSRVARQVTAAQRAAVLGHVLAVGPEIRRSAAHGAGLVRLALTEAPPATARYATTYLPHMLAAVVGTVVAGVVLALYAPLVALLAVASLAAVPLVQELWRKRLGRRGEAYWSASAAFADRLDDTVRGLDDIVRTSAAERIEERLGRVADDVRRTAVEALRVTMVVYVATTVLLGVGSVGALVVLAWQAGGTVAVGSALVVWALLPEAARPLQSLREAWFAGHSALTAQTQIDRVLDIPVPLADATTPGSGPALGTSPPELELVGASVLAESDGAVVQALVDVDARFPAGATTALLGESGSGKSTLLSLLMRHRDPSAGRVLIDGVDVRELPLEAVRGLFGWVSQDVVLFDGTVADNLRLARPEATPAEVAAAAREARLLLPLAEGGLSDGLATQVGDNGRLLSGGQRQRVALARALLRDAPVLVLDEPTAALDDHNQAAVVAAIAAATRGRTVVVVSHRRDGLPPLDGVVRLSAGRVLVDAR